MLKIAKSLLTIIAVAAIATGATGAYFTDQVTVANNQFTAGTKVDIDIRGAGATAQTFANMAPGVWTAPVEYQIYNLADSLPVKYKFQDGKVSESVPGFYNKINVRVRHTHAGTANPESWPIVYTGLLTNLNITSTGTPGIISPTLGSNITHVFYLEYQLDGSTGNTFQGATAVANLVFDATQAINPGW